eukprot:2359050-Pyramimonas_sp.AAC.1
MGGIGHGISGGRYSYDIRTRFHNARHPYRYTTYIRVRRERLAVHQPRRRHMTNDSWLVA